MRRIRVDFGNQARPGHYRLNTVGALADIEAFVEPLHVGERVVLYDPDELEMEANLEFDAVWIGVGILETVVYYGEPPLDTTTGDSAQIQTSPHETDGEPDHA